ncbi:MAG TPA: hypothetical protein VJN39_09895 [Gemmatimonadales bacterium]|nr:hypothetical protein [Gemmatimonadales bacterium]
MAAQTTQATLDELRTPASPAFVLLGVAPSAVERPTTPKALAATLLAASGDLQFFPKNYAIEVAPYWLSSHPSLTYERFHDPGVWQSLKQTLSLSLAASRSSPILSDSGTAVGLGARMFVSSGFTDRKQLDALTAQLDTVQQQQNLATLRNAPTAVGDSLAIKNDRLTRQLQALVQDRLGYIVEAAAALIAAYPLDAFAKGRVARVGAWVTQTYRLHHPQADVLVVSRFIRDVGAARNLYDVGGRLAYSNRGLTIAGEYVGRFGRSRADKTHRAAGTLEYRWAEGKYITATFGRNFDESTGKTLIALIGVDLGFGKVPMLGLK